MSRKNIGLKVKKIGWRKCCTSELTSALVFSFQRTSVPFALVRKVLDTRAVPSTVSSPTSCAREATLPAATELVENPSTERSKPLQLNESVGGHCVGSLAPLHYSCVV